MKGVILTAKHHDGFCLWPSKYTDYSVKNSPWKNGKGDLVKEMSEACKEYGLKLGIYLSPWDRNRADYGKPSYIQYFRNQLTELLTNYGDVFEVWFDGANGGWGYYGGARENRVIDRATYYDWPNTIALIRKLQPNAIIWNECGPDIRWCGNEQGSIGETNWNRFDAKEYIPGMADSRVLRTGRENGNDWVPGEVNVSIRPGWFYHTYEDAKVKTLPQLLDIYHQSIGRGSCWLLNFPIDRRGLIHETDARAVVELRAAIDRIHNQNLGKKASFSASCTRGNSKRYGAAKVNDGKADTYWATDDKVTQASIVATFKKPTTFNSIMIQEYIRKGQRVKAFTVEALVDGQWKQLAQETTIGYKRILRLPKTTATKVRVNIAEATACLLLSNIEIYNTPQILEMPRIARNKEGWVSITPCDRESAVFYTLDGSTPNMTSIRYTKPFNVTAGTTVKAIAVDESTKKQSTASTEEFDISHQKWNVIAADKDAMRVIDGNEGSNWHQRGVMPMDLTIDLGEELDLDGFRYLPDQSALFASGFISFYEFYTSSNGRDWHMATQGEFANIRNNPNIWQSVRFNKTTRARYIRLRALKNSSNDKVAGYCEIDVITKK